MGTEGRGWGAPSSERVRDCPTDSALNLCLGTWPTLQLHRLMSLWGILEGPEGTPWELVGAPPRPDISVYLAEMGHLPRDCSTLSFLCVSPPELGCIDNPSLVRQSVSVPPLSRLGQWIPSLCGDLRFPGSFFYWEVLLQV